MNMDKKLGRNDLNYSKSISMTWFMLPGKTKNNRNECDTFTKEPHHSNMLELLRRE